MYKKKQANLKSLFVSLSASMYDIFFIKIDCFGTYNLEQKKEKFKTSIREGGVFCDKLNMPCAQNGNA